MIQISQAPTLKGTPNCLLRAMTAPELRQRLATLNASYPPSYRPRNELDTRFLRTAISEMIRIRRELSARGEPTEPEKKPLRPIADWPAVETGDVVDSDEWGRAVVTGVSWKPGEKYGFVHLRILADSKLRAVHPSTLTLVEKGT